MTTARTTRPAVLAVGIVALEFASAVSRFVGGTLLPVVARDLHASDQLVLLVAGSTLGLFVALPAAGQAFRAAGARGVLAAGLVGYSAGLAVSAAAERAWIFAAGQFAAGLASGLLAVFGVSAAIRHLDRTLRLRVVAASSAMWILPALVGPAATLGLEHLIGWRWTLLTPLPVVLTGRLLVASAVHDDQPAVAAAAPGVRSLLVPAGVAVIVLGGSVAPVVAAGGFLTIAGAVALMPSGTTRLAPGAPAGLAAMAMFATGYFGADALITVLLTSGYHQGLGRAAIVLGAAPLGWGLTSVAVTRVRPAAVRRRLPVVGLAAAAAGVAAVALGAAALPSFTLALAGWSVAGCGVGMAYPVLYVAATTPGPSDGDAERLAAAVITAEAVGSVLGGALGGAIAAGAHVTGLTAAYAVFAAALAGAAAVAVRATVLAPADARGKAPVSPTGE